MPRLPEHYELSRAQLVFSAGSIAAAFALLGWNAATVAVVVRWAWWVPAALAAGMAAADLLSGLIHWAADTWGRDDLPIVGHRLLVPFRVHHVNPDDFLRRSFIDTNGDVAFLAIPCLLALRLVPLDTAWGAPVAVASLGFCAVGSMTNQIHQWAHMPSPPRLVRWLQRAGIVLRHLVHAEHHAHPYDASYCIATGWWNALLNQTQFFRRFERGITWLTGAQPREDDGRYEMRFVLSSVPREEAP